MKTHGLLITNERSNAYRTKLISSPITTTKPSLLLWRVAFWAVDISGNRCTPTRDEGIPQCTATSHSYGGFHCYLWGNTGPFIICSLANGALSRGIGAPYRCMHSSSTTRVSQWCKTSSNDPRPPLRNKNNRSWFFRDEKNSTAACAHHFSSSRCSNCRRTSDIMICHERHGTARVLSKCQTNVKRNVRFLLVNRPHCRLKEFDIIELDLISIFQVTCFIEPTIV